MTLKIGKYDVCLLDLVIDPKTNKLSATKAWFHIANAIMSRAVLIEPHVDYLLMASYGSIVGGSLVGVQFAKNMRKR